jgi:hypothetical protein
LVRSTASAVAMSCQTSISYGETPLSRRASRKLICLSRLLVPMPALLSTALRPRAQAIASLKIMEGLLEVSQLEMWTAGIFVRGRARRLWSPV